MTTFLNDDLAPADSDEQAEAMAHDALVFEVSSALARLDGCDDPHHLIWEGGPVPEPWGEVWQRYEPQAKEVINTIGDGLAQAMVEALRPHGVMAAPASPTDAQILELARQQGDEAEHGFIFNRDGRWSVLTFARALLALGVPEPLIGASEPPGSVQCSVCKAITAPGNGCSAEDCPVGVAPSHGGEHDES